MAAQNGLGGAGNAAMYAGMNGQVLPSAGHYADMQTLFQNMEQLGGMLAQNREDWRLVQEGLARVERLRGRTHNDSNGLPNGDNSTSHTNELLDETPTTIELQAALSSADTRIASLERTCAEQVRLQQLYEDTLSEATERIRQYCFEQQQHAIALHQHYNHLLAQSRGETVEAQLTHQAWQAGLKRVSEKVRQAMISREEEGQPWKKRIAALKEENRVLRAKAGWEPPVDSDEEEGDEQPDAPDFRRGRVPASSGAIGRGAAEVLR